MSSRAYYTLIASLPPLPPYFDVERAPISRARLWERLKMLAEDDAAVVQQWVDFVVWDQQSLDCTDEEFAARFAQIMDAISNPTLRRMLDIRMDIRTLVAALRHRRAGLPAPLGVGASLEHIRRNFHHPEFQLQGRFDWIGRFDALLEAGDAMGAQRLLFETNYRIWTRMSQNYTFSFEAVLLYLARWEIIDRWTSSDAQAGQERFTSMLTETLGEYAHLFQ
ncbi:MAG: DUF2764 family protein [Pirellulaceae bacterium]|nr:DUF2764 family protein [Pirellulaceae bacterium]